MVTQQASEALAEGGARQVPRTHTPAFSDLRDPWTCDTGRTLPPSLVTAPLPHPQSFHLPGPQWAWLQVDMARP